MVDPSGRSVDDCVDGSSPTAVDRLDSGSPPARVRRVLAERQVRRPRPSEVLPRDGLREAGRRSGLVRPGQRDLVRPFAHSGAHLRSAVCVVPGASRPEHLLDGCAALTAGPAPRGRNPDPVHRPRRRDDQTRALAGLLHGDRVRLDRPDLRGGPRGDRGPGPDRRNDGPEPGIVLLCLPDRRRDHSGRRGGLGPARDTAVARRRRLPCARRPRPRASASSRRAACASSRRGRGGRRCSISRGRRSTTSGSGRGRGT